MPFTRAPESPNKPEAFPTILVTLSDAPWCVPLVRTLQQHGYLVLKADNVVEALRVARIHSRPIQVFLSEDGEDSRSLAATLKPYRPEMRPLFVARDHHASLPDSFAPEHVVATVREILKPPKATE